MDQELIRRLPKTDLHVHLDGSLRLASLIDLARERKVPLPSETSEGLQALVFRPRYASLAEYLEGFRYTVAVLQDAESLERAAFELAEDCQADGVRYVEVRFAPQLHVRPGFEVPDVVRAVDRFRRFFEALPEASEREIHSAASLEVARAAARLRSEEGLLVVGIDLAGQEKGYPAEDHRKAYQIAHESFLGKTVHAGEDYGPESIFQAIGDLHADRIGHGTWLFDDTKITSPRIRDRKRYVENSPPTCASTRSPRCGAAGSRPRSAPTTAWSRTRPSATRSPARSKPSRSRRRRCATS